MAQARDLVLGELRRSSADQFDHGELQALERDWRWSACRSVDRQGQCGFTVPIRAHHELVRTGLDGREADATELVRARFGDTQRVERLQFATLQCGQHSLDGRTVAGVDEGTAELVGRCDVDLWLVLVGVAGSSTTAPPMRATRRPRIPLDTWADDGAIAHQSV